MCRMLGQPHVALIMFSAQVMHRRTSCEEHNEPGKGVLCNAGALAWSLSIIMYSSCCSDNCRICISFCVYVCMCINTNVYIYICIYQVIHVCNIVCTEITCEHWYGWLQHTPMSVGLCIITNEFETQPFVGSTALPTGCPLWVFPALPMSFPLACLAWHCRWGRASR